MGKTAIVVLGVVAFVGVALVLGCAPPGPEPSVLGADSFVLAAHDEQSAEYQNLVNYFDEFYNQYGQEALKYIPKPFNMAGRYYNSVFLEEGEQVTLHIRSDQYATVQEIERDFSGFPMLVHVSLGQGSEDGLSADDAEGEGVSYEASGADGNWNLDLSFTARNTGDYLLWVENYASTECRCDYSAGLAS